MALLETHLELLRQRFPQADLQVLPSGEGIVVIPEFPLPTGWNATQTTVSFVAPVGYPFAKPDCFWTSPSLRLISGAMPASTGYNPRPGTTDQWLWFSWHMERWDPNRDSIVTYAYVIDQRFQRAQ